MRIRPAAITLALLALVAGLAAALATPSPASAAGKPCWERVIDDWLDNGTIDGKYKAACYQQALNHIDGSGFEDLRDYSNITDAIQAALNGSLRGGGSGTGNGNSSGGGNSGNTDSGPNRETQGVPGPSYYTQGINHLGTTKARSIPIPLLVLAALGALLLVSAGGLAAHKRLKARPPAPPAT